MNETMSGWRSSVPTAPAAAAIASTAASSVKGLGMRAES
jgi:hypothetical protein